MIPEELRKLPYRPRPRARRKKVEATPTDAPTLEPGRVPVVWAYGRVSSEKQRAEGKTSLDGQAEVMKRKFESRYKDTHEYGGFFEDAVSAAKLSFSERPTGKELCQKMKAGDVLIVAKVDRFSREGVYHGLAEVKRLRARGVRLLCLDIDSHDIEVDGGPGELVLMLMLWAASQERKRIIERTTEGTRRAEARRKALGIPRTPRVCPYGMKRTGKKRYSPDLEWREYVRKLWALHKFAREKLGYSDYDMRFANLLEWWDLYWWKHYSLRRRDGRPQDYIPAVKTWLTWVAKELELQKKEAAEGKPPPDPVEEPWREAFERRDVMRSSEIIDLIPADAG
jgi:DNA invertase Pin-like site-specific DNA recombinase